MSDGALSRALQQRAVLHEFGLESGQAMFALFF
jgi:hypothetical protein